MLVPKEYLHALEGRLRIKVPEIKGSPVRAGELEKEVQWHPGVDYIKANPTTGNVLIYYDSQKIEQEKILRAMQEAGYLQSLNFLNSEGAGTREAKSSIVENVVATVAQSIMEVALTKLVTAII